MKINPAENSKEEINSHVKCHHNSPSFLSIKILHVGIKIRITSKFVMHTIYAKGMIEGLSE